MLAYQFAFHVFVLHEIEPGSRNDGLSQLTVFAGAPCAAVWARALTLSAEHVFGGHVPRRVLLGAALWLVAIVVVFVTYGLLRQGANMMSFWFEAVMTYTVPAFVLSLLGIALHVGQMWWEIFPCVAMGVPSVGPMLLLFWWAGRPRRIASAREER